MFGENLVKFRKQCGLTQAQLAQKLNVTSQAVSRWEKGAYPDSELLPSVAAALGVTIDQLFGYSAVYADPDLELMINDKIHHTDETERADVVMKLLYSVIGAYTEYQHSKIRYPENLELETYAELRTDHEMALARLNEDLKYCCFMKIPDDGLYSYIGDTERMVNLFETLADEDALKLICYLGTGWRNRLQSLEFISRNTDIPLKKLSRIMVRLDRLGIVWRVAVDDKSDNTDESSIVYGYVNSSPLTFIMTLAKSLTQYIRFHDCDICSWQHGPYHMPEVNIDKPVPQAGLWSDENKNNNNSEEEN
ncbi:MAG: helix-turn-helix domain-containing protein [Alistipes sp.]|nr:helix-turn-helix domain-containing protein [Alistipes sp.]